MPFGVISFLYEQKIAGSNGIGPVLLLAHQGHRFSNAASSSRLVGSIPKMSPRVIFVPGVLFPAEACRKLAAA